MKTTKLPTLFIGHGSPMNAILENSFSRRMNLLGKELPRPQAILMISAHWMSKGTFVTTAANPKMIYDMSGFPDELYRVKYPSPGAPDLAKRIIEILKDDEIESDEEQWGYDHGMWSVLTHLYPKADIPVIQLSMDMSKPPSFHKELGARLAFLREQGVLILASGNVVHNLRRIKWEPDAEAYDWAIEFDKWFHEKMNARDFSAITNDFSKTEAGRLSVPTVDHYLPLLYIIGAADSNDKLSWVYEESQNGSISMTSFMFESK